MEPRKIDLHMHTIASDGTDDPAEILAQVKKASIDLFSVTDHDTIKSCEKIKKLLKKGDPSFIFGVEFSCKNDEGKYHILGYGFDPSSPAINEILLSCHMARLNRVKNRLEFIEKNFGFVFSREDVESLFTMDNPGKPHIGNLMVKYGYVKSREDAIMTYLNQYKNDEQRIHPEQAIKAISEAGGIPVLAHPSFGSGEEYIVGEDMDKRLKKLVSYGLQGVEAYYSEFTPELTDEMLAFADKYDLYVTAGSDYHGNNKKIRLGDTKLEDPSEYPEGLRRFLQRFAE